jgi:serine/threonine protein kinase
MIDRFFKEAEIIALADHPNIVKLYGHGQWEGGLYIAMEYIQGTLLKDYIIQNTTTLERAIELTLNIAGALCHLHTNGIIHRDLKPENIIITEENEIKVIDFGIAQLLLTQGSARITQDSKLMGTPVYMSPEQQDNPSAVSYPSDIYSLGIIAFELMTSKLCHGTINLAAIPPKIRAILNTALKADLEERYQDIVDFMMDLSAYLKEGVEEPVIEDLPIQDSTHPPKAEESKEPEKKKKKEEEKEEKEELPSNNEAFEELMTNLKEAQSLLIPPVIPSWSPIDIGLINHSGSGVSGVYFDFFELKDGAYGVIMGECAAGGAQGVIFTAVLRGMIRSLSWSATKPVELVAYLNDLLTNDTLDQIFTLSYLILYPDRNQLHFISCGYGNLWHIQSGSDTPQKISADNIALGIDPEAEFLEVNHEWGVGNSIILNTFRAMSPVSEKEKGFTEKDFKLALKKKAFLPPQKQADALFKKVSKSIRHSLDERPITIISLQRVS